MELRPSSFTLLSTGDVKYVGPLMDVKSMNQETINKRALEHEVFTHDRKKQKLDDAKLKMPEMQFIPRDGNDKASSKTTNTIIHDKCNAKNNSKDEVASMGKFPEIAQLERSGILAKIMGLISKILFHLMSTIWGFCCLRFLCVLNQ